MSYASVDAPGSSTIEVVISSNINSQFPKEYYDQMTQLTRNLYLSNFYTARNRTILKKYNIKHVLTIISQREYLRPNEKHDGIHYKHIIKEDREWEDIISGLPSGIQFIENAVKKNENILVHCFMGVSRSVTFVLTYLMKAKNISFDKALSFLRERRAVVNPNQSFSYQIKLYQRMQFNLDITFWEYRLFILNIHLLCDYPRNFHRMLGLYFSYMKHLNNWYILHYNEPIITRKYGCKLCNTYLFHSLNKLRLPYNRNDDTAQIERSLMNFNKNGSNNCQNIYLEPLEWMMDIFEDFPRYKSGPIYCFKCKAHLGKYDFFSTSYHPCSCPQHCGMSTIIRLLVHECNIKELTI